jgi:hypothetical protein
LFLTVVVVWGTSWLPLFQLGVVAPEVACGASIASAVMFAWAGLRASACAFRL